MRNISLSPHVAKVLSAVFWACSHVAHWLTGIHRSVKSSTLQGKLFHRVFDPSSMCPRPVQWNEGIANDFIFLHHVLTSNSLLAENFGRFILDVFFSDTISFRTNFGQNFGHYKVNLRLQNTNQTETTSVYITLKVLARYWGENKQKFYQVVT